MGLLIPSATEIEMVRAVFSWSGGKDGAHALDKIQDSKEYEITDLLTTVSETTQRSVHHGIRKELIQSQSEELDIPVNLVELPEGCTNDEYEEIMSQVLANYRERGIDTMVFGDIHLEDVRKYREENLSKADFKGHWPMWGEETTDLIQGFLAAGFKATIVAVNTNNLDRSFVGREVNRDFLDDLPEDVDPYGEYGEYHTYVWDGPIFNTPIHLEEGEKVERQLGDATMYYCDLHERSKS
ncbi:MAG: ATP-binding protein [Halobacteriaceae archaeon]